MKPNIYEYGTAVSFLQDFYKFYTSDSSKSLRQLSEQMGFTSPTLLLDILRMKRPIKLKYGELLVKGMDLNAKEKVYFETLLKIENVADVEKKYFQDVLSQLRPDDFGKFSDLSLFSHWINIVVHFLGQRPGSSYTIQDVHNSLVKKVPLSVIEQSLDLLQDNRLIERKHDGSFISTGPNFLTTPNDVSIDSSHSYYSQILTLANNAIKLPLNTREFQCFAINIKKESLQSIKEVMREARQKIAFYSEPDGDQIYQFNLNGFPLTNETQLYLRKMTENRLEA